MSARLSAATRRGYWARFEARILSGRYFVRSVHPAGNENEWHARDRFARHLRNGSERRRRRSLLEDPRPRRVRQWPEQQLAGDSDRGTAVPCVGAKAHSFRADICQTVSDSVAASKIPRRRQRRSPRRKSRRRLRNRSRQGPQHVG